MASWDEFLDADRAKRLILAPHCGAGACEAQIKAETQGVTARCIPRKGEKPEEGARCVKCDAPAAYKAYFARAY